MSREKQQFNEKTITKIRIKLSEQKDGRNDKPDSKTEKRDSDKPQTD